MGIVVRYDSRAYLRIIRNVPRGLESRDRILNKMQDQEWRTAADIAKELAISYSTVLYHLRNLMSEGAVERGLGKQGWRVLESPQGTLLQFLGKKQTAKQQAKRKKSKAL
ncbi:MAG: ArsR family transcriptional regulator [Candidatus Thorarchaeota archaeon]